MLLTKKGCGVSNRLTDFKHCGGKIHQHKGKPSNSCFAKNGANRVIHQRQSNVRNNPKSVRSYQHAIVKGGRPAVKRDTQKVH